MRELGVVVCLLLLTTACATAGTGTVESARVDALAGLAVESSEDGTVVRLSGVQDPVFSAFQQDGRVVVDIAGVGIGNVPPSTTVYDGTVDEVTVGRFVDDAGSAAARVEVQLGTDATFEVVTAGRQLEIHVAPAADAGLGTDTLAATTLEAAPVAAEPESLPASLDDTETAEPLAVAAAPASALVGIEAVRDGAGSRIELVTDGAVQDFTSFVIEDPTRLVVDLPGLINRIPASRLALDASGVTRARIGQHDGKVRVVLDGAEGSDVLVNAETATFDSGLVVAVGGASLPAVAAGMEPGGDAEVEAMEPADVDPWTETETGEVAGEALSDEPEMAADESGEALAVDDAAMDAMDEVASDESADAGESMAASDDATSDEGPMLASEEEDDSTRVTGVDLEAGAAADRVIVSGTAPLQYTVVEADAETVVLRLVDASLSQDAITRVTPAQPGAVSLVSAFDQPEAGFPEVRVVIRRAAGVAPVVVDDGQDLVLEFARGAAAAGSVPVAAVEPVDAANPGPAALDPEGTIELLEEGGLTDGKIYTGRRVSLDFKDVDIDDVLRLIAEVSDLNIIAGDEVSGNVTIRLVDVPWDQALDVILLTKGLGFVRVGNVLRIAPADQLKSEEEARLQERRAKEKLEDLAVKLQPVNYASVKEVEKMVKRLLTPRGSVDVDERTNTVILKDIPSVIDEATALIKAIDTQTPQVLIEAKIVEANLDFSKEIGSQWAFGTQPLNDGFDGQSGNRQDLTIGGANNVQFHNNPLLSGFTDTFNHVSVTNPITSVPTGLLDLGAFLLDQKFNVELRLEAAESHGEGKVISSPRVVTLDNRKASIEQGVSIPFQTFENGDAKLEFIDAVLRLEVTPHITADRSIIMKIEVNRNAPDDSVQTPTGSPAIAKNEAETETLVKDGQTLVIGGIYTIEKSERQSRVPYFHKIPVLGLAFRNNETRDIRKELLVFVTPRIVVNPEVGA